MGMIHADTPSRQGKAQAPVASGESGPPLSVLRTGRFWLGMGLSAACLWLALRQVPFSDFGRILGGGRYAWLAPAFALQILAIVGRAWRWDVLLNREGGRRNAFWAQAVGFLFSNVFPLRMGEAARAVVLAGSSRLPLIRVVGSVLVERLLDVATVLLALAIVLPWMEVPILVARAGQVLGWLVLAGLLGIGLLARFRQFSERVVDAVLRRLPFLPRQPLLARWAELVDGFAPLLRPRPAALAVLWSFVIWGLYVGVYWCVLRAFRADAALVEATFMVVALALALTVPSSPGFIGVFQYAGQQALAIPFSGRYDAGTALAATMAGYLVFYASTTILGVIGLWKAGESFSRLGRALMGWGPSTWSARARADAPASSPGALDEEPHEKEAQIT